MDREVHRQAFLRSLTADINNSEPRDVRPGNNWGRGRKRIIAMACRV